MTEKMSESTYRHKAEAPSHLNFALITISTSRYKALKTGKSIKNPSGDIIINILQEAGNKVIYTDVVSDNGFLIRKSLKAALNLLNVDAIIMCGGTGITKTDITIETVSPLLEKYLPGFGEIFRKLSFENVGSAAIITRATAGVINGKAIFCLPGSPQAVELALKSLILPETGHIVKHARE